MHSRAMFEERGLEGRVNGGRDEGMKFKWQIIIYLERSMGVFVDKAKF